VPVVSIAAAAPSFATVSGCCELSSSGTANWEPNELNYIDINLDIENDCNQSLTGLTVVITVCGLDDLTYTGDDEYLPDGWVQGGKPNAALTPDGNGCYVFTYTTGQSLGAAMTISPTFVVKTQAYDGQGGNRPGGSITVNVSGGDNCTANGTNIDLPAVSKD
jgi:hypothetical protein